MSEKGLCSRREADALIEQGLVTLNGNIVNLGQKGFDDDEILILREGLEALTKKVTLALNKPRDFVSSQPEKGYRTALELIVKENFAGTNLKKFHPKGLAPLGRLDIDSTGLILYSQDGVLAKKIIGKESAVEKEYEVNVIGKITDQVLKKLRHGLELDGITLKPAKIKQVSKTKMIFILKQGRKRQIRRMCELVGLKVRRIHRLRIGKLHIGTLPEGKWRFVEHDEII